MVGSSKPFHTHIHSPLLTESDLRDPLSSGLSQFLALLKLTQCFLSDLELGGNDTAECLASNAVFLQPCRISGNEAGDAEARDKEKSGWCRKARLSAHLKARTLGGRGRGALELSVVLKRASLLTLPFETSVGITSC